MSRDNQQEPETWASRVKAVAYQSFVTASNVVTYTPTYIVKKSMLVPSAVAGKGPGDFDGSSEKFQQKFDQMSLVLKKMREFNTTSGMKDEDMKIFNDRFDQIETARVARLKIAEEILKIDEEEKKK